MRRSSAVCFVAMLGCLCAVAQQAQPNIPNPLSVTIDTQQTADPVSKYVFGSFIEHIGTLIYRSMWAELIDDRKFYFPISSKDSETPHTQSGHPMRQQLHKWRPVGPDEVITMDADHPFVGDHSPKISLDAKTAHGIRQSGFSLVSGKQYSGRVYLRGSAGTKVSVSLIWGAGDSDRQTSIFTLNSAYKKFPLSFSAKADSSDAAIEITGIGSGDFHVGAISLMPVDNVQGFRHVTIALLM